MLQFTDETAPHQLAFESFGVELRLCASSPELLARAEPFLPPGWRPCAQKPDQYPLGILEEPGNGYLLYKGPTCISEGHGLEYSLTMLEGQIRGHVAVLAPARTFVHAGAVEHEGRAIICPGYSFAGKTTLTEAFVRAGATYYSDEYAVLDSDGLVHPYPKPLSIRSGEQALQAEHPVESLNGVAGVDPIPLALVVITYYRSGADWAPRELSPGEAALGVLSHTVTARTRTDEAIRAISRAVENAVTLEGERGEASELAPRLLAQLEHEPAGPAA
jgi:hypothetical protein